jgi:hypothetical protein
MSQAGTPFIVLARVKKAALGEGRAVVIQGAGLQLVPPSSRVLRGGFQTRPYNRVDRIARN